MEKTKHSKLLEGVDKVLVHKGVNFKSDFGNKFGEGEYEKIYKIDIYEGLTLKEIKEEISKETGIEPTSFSTDTIKYSDGVEIVAGKIKKKIRHIDITRYPTQLFPRI